MSRSSSTGGGGGRGGGGGGRGSGISSGMTGPPVFIAGGACGGGTGDGSIMGIGIRGSSGSGTFTVRTSSATLEMRCLAV